MGLSLKELAIVGVVFVGLGEVLSFWTYGRAASVVAALLLFLALQIANRKLEAHFVEKVFRYLQTPTQLGRKIWLPKIKSGDSHE